MSINVDVDHLLSWTSLLCIVCLALCLYVVKISYSSNIACGFFNAGNKNNSENPYKGKIGAGYLTEEKQIEIARKIHGTVTYDASQVSCLKNFQRIKQRSECIFAKRSRLWGSLEFDTDLTLEENMFRLYPTFLYFTMAFQDLGVDAFVVELPGKLYGANIEIFGDAVRRTLKTLIDCDLFRQRKELMENSHKLNETDIKNRLRYLVNDPQQWSRRSWVFEVNKVTFFVTTFAPFYPDTNSRFSFGSQNCFILFQPELAFAIRDLPQDTPNTNWEKPETVRDKIRVAFRDAGREYEPPMKLQLPMVYEIVKPLDPHDTFLMWWLPAGDEKGKDCERT